MSSTFWEVPKMFSLEDSAVLIGGGPSVKTLTVQEMEVLKRKDILKIGINQAYEFGEEIVDICFFGDIKWFDWNKKQLLSKYNGIIITCNAQPAVFQYLKIKKLIRSESFGIHKKQNTVCWNKCSGNAAINLAYLFGVGKIYLLGYDMKVNGNIKNYHDFYKDKEVLPRKREEYLNERYETFRKALKKVYQDLTTEGIFLYHGTLGSTADFIPYKSLLEI